MNNKSIPLWKLFLFKKFEKRLLRRYKKILLIILARLRLKRFYWHFKGYKDSWETKLGYKKCKYFFNMIYPYQKRILKEKDYKRRGILYSQLYNEIFKFLRKNMPDAWLGFYPALIENNFELFKDKIVIDYGCGYGESTELISKKAKFVHGIDASKICIELAKKKFNNLKNINFKINSTPFMSFDNKTIDIVYSNDLIEHLHPDDAIIHLKEVYRVLKEGGKYLFWTPEGNNGPHDCTRWFYPPGNGFKSKGGHIKEYTFNELITILKKVGYKKIELPDLNKEVLMIVTK